LEKTIAVWYRVRAGWLVSCLEDRREIICWERASL